MWTYGDIRIFVTGKSDQDKQIIARLQPIQDGTIYQAMGWEKPITKIVGYVVGETDRRLFGYFKVDGLGHTLLGYGVDYGSFLLSSVSFEREQTIYQTLRTDLDCDEPVFSFSAELYRETDY